MPQQLADAASLMDDERRLTTRSRSTHVRNLALRKHNPTFTSPTPRIASFRAINFDAAQPDPITGFSGGP
jgi:hypothetical protein